MVNGEDEVLNQQAIQRSLISTPSTTQQRTLTRGSKGFRRIKLKIGNF